MFNRNIISDATWTKWATELCELQKQYPDIAQQVPYHDAFKDFDPSTGYDLPLNDPWAYGKAEYLMKKIKC